MMLMYLTFSFVEFSSFWVRIKKKKKHGYDVWDTEIGPADFYRKGAWIKIERFSKVRKKHTYMDS